MWEQCAKLPSLQVIVACAREHCQAANLSGFRFCSTCGEKRRVVQLQQANVAADDTAIAARREQVMRQLAGKSHERSKDRELDALTAFLRSRPTASLRRTNVFEATPSDVVDFLVHRDLTGKGRTKVHTADCTDRSTKCSCPSRMAQSAVQALVSKVKTRLYELGCAGEWNSLSSTGNPADAAAVNKYLIAIKEEQGRAGCAQTTARARAMLPRQLRDLINYMRNLAYLQYSRDRVRWVQILQDIAWVTIQFRALNRGAELSNLRTDNTIIGPNESCVAFQVSFSKVLRGDGPREFGAPALPGDDTCPVRAFKQYIQETRNLFHWDWEAGSFWVFPYISATGARMDSAVTAQAMGQRFNKYLQRLSHSLGGSGSVIVESLHGLRAGGALCLAMDGASLREVMLQGFWNSPKTAMRYVGILESIIGQEFKDAMKSRGVDQHWTGSVSAKFPETRFGLGERTEK